MFLVTTSSSDKKRMKNMYECTDFQLTETDTGMIFSLNREGKGENITLVINGETPRRIFIMSDTGRTIDRYSFKCK